MRKSVTRSNFRRRYFKRSQVRFSNDTRRYNETHLLSICTHVYYAFFHRSWKLNLLLLLSWKNKKMPLNDLLKEGSNPESPAWLVLIWRDLRIVGGSVRSSSNFRATTITKNRHAMRTCVGFAAFAKSQPHLNLIPWAFPDTPFLLCTLYSSPTHQSVWIQTVKPLILICFQGNICQDLPST